MIQPLIYLFSSWLFIIITCCGIGLALQRLIGIERKDAEGVLIAFWIGWAVIIGVLQLIHLFVPIKPLVSVAIVILGFTSFLLNRGIVRIALMSKEVRNPLFILWIIFSVLFIGLQAMGPIGPHDSGLYHLQTIQWLSSFPIVPGLGNLHGRLAFNNAVFLYNAALNISIWSNKTHHLANGVLLLIFYVRIGLSLSRLLLKKSTFQGLDLFLLLLIPAIIKLSFRQASTTHAGFSLWLIGLIIGVELWYLLYDNSLTSKRMFEIVFTIVLLSSVGVAIKLSFIGFGFLSSVIALFVWLRANFEGFNISEKIRKTVVFSLPPILILVPWIIRSVILSGYMAFPNTMTVIKKDWRVPVKTAIDYERKIKAWAKQPGVDPKIVLENSNWIKPWIKEKIKYKFDIILPVIMFIIGALFSFIRVRNKARNSLRNYILFHLPPLGSIVFVMAQAPDPRFIYSALWYLACGSFAIGFIRLFYGEKRNAILLCFLITFSFAVLISVKEIMKEKGNVVFGFRNGFYPVPSLKEWPYREYITNSGLILNVPIKSAQCWNTPLPCTPYPNKRLKLREYGSIGSGFMIDPENNRE